jgi:hypothetical protein
MPVVLEVDYDITDKYHESNHCCNGNKIVYSDTTQNRLPPSKKFITNNFNNSGEYVGTELNVLDYSKEGLYGCSMCGSVRNYKATDARIVYHDDTLRKRILETMDSDEDEPASKPVKPSVKNASPIFLSPGYKKRCMTKKCNFGTTCNRRNNTANPCYYNHS